MIRQESWDLFYPDCLPLFKEHDDEIGDDDELDPDIETYKALSDAGILQIITARQDNKLVGYCLFLISRSLKNKNVLCGAQNLWFVTKEKRKGGLGIKLFLKSIEVMKARGVKRIYPHYYLAGNDKQLKRFFESLGAVEYQHEFNLGI